MKKIFYLLLCFVIALCCFSGCNQQNNSTDSTASSNQESEQTLSVEFLTEDNLTIEVGESYQLEWQIVGDYTGVINWRANNAFVSVNLFGEVIGFKEGQTRVSVLAGEALDSINITVVEGETPLTNPYENVNKEEFYANYTPAKNFLDAQFRSELYLMSGDISDQDQMPTIADNRPIEGDLYLKNTHGLYSTDKKVYYVLDENGEIAFEVYKGGAYVTLEEVAAYVFAFNTVPENYAEDKKTKPYESEWGKYLRLNHSRFTGDTNKYPYEPELPNISGCGGDYEYYEIDVGTTGTTAGNYPVNVYNNGSSITRGAARIVYSRFENGNEVTDFSQRYLFYTRNHYNDFQEYLNYQNGWGEIFGNETGGGELSSKYDYNPTPYVSVALKNFWLLNDYSLATSFAKYL